MVGKSVMLLRMGQKIKKEKPEFFHMLIYSIIYTFVSLFLCQHTFITILVSGIPR